MPLWSPGQELRDRLPCALPAVSRRRRYESPQHWPARRRRHRRSAARCFPHLRTPPVISSPRVQLSVGLRLPKAVNVSSAARNTSASRRPPAVCSATVRGGCLLLAGLARPGSLAAWLSFPGTSAALLHAHQCVRVQTPVAVQAPLSCRSSRAAPRRPTSAPPPPTHPPTHPTPTPYPPTPHPPPHHPSHPPTHTCLQACRVRMGTSATGVWACRQTSSTRSFPSRRSWRRGRSNATEGLRRTRRRWSASAFIVGWLAGWLIDWVIGRCINQWTAGGVDAAAASGRLTAWPPRCRTALALAQHRRLPSCCPPALRALSWAQGGDDQPDGRQRAAQQVPRPVQQARVRGGWLVLRPPRHAARRPAARCACMHGLCVASLRRCASCVPTCLPLPSVLPWQVLRSLGRQPRRGTLLQMPPWV